MWQISYYGVTNSFNLRYIDGMVGEVLFWSLRQVLGPNDYNLNAHRVWIRVYSRMLKVMVPIAVAHELKDGSAQEKRFFGQSLGLKREEEMALQGLESLAKSGAPSKHMFTVGSQESKSQTQPPSMLLGVEQPIDQGQYDPLLRNY